MDATIQIAHRTGIGTGSRSADVLWAARMCVPGVSRPSRS